jgi:hypothetical protein
MVRLELTEDECTLILSALEDAHVALQGSRNPYEIGRMEAINEPEEKIKEADSDDDPL